jgi:mRNA interferase MazF
VIQTDLLNKTAHPSTLITTPLTTQLSSRSHLLRFRITQREKLNQGSDVMLDQVRAIDNYALLLLTHCETAKPRMAAT